MAVEQWTDGQRDRFIKKLVASVADQVQDHFKHEAARKATSFDSPIELAFYLAWQLRHFWYLGQVSGTLALLPQYKVSANGRDYRLDFAIIHEGLRVAIENDGHEFHERTPEQVDYRNQRDLDLQNDGWTIVHLSGRQILHDPAGCVQAVQDACVMAWDRILVAGGKF